MSNLILILLIMAVLQVFLSMQKNKWWGIIILVFYNLNLLIYTCNAFSFSFVALFVMLIIDVIYFGIYFICRNNLKEKNIDEITKMRIDDLE